MPYQSISFNFRKKKFKIKARICGCLQRSRGLMFRKKENAEPLLFEFSKSTNLKIHSFFVFFDFLAIWFDEKGKIIEVKKIKPFNFCVIPKKPFKKLLEIPLNSKYKLFRNSSSVIRNI
ncbi:hypothetical protein FJZ20_00360 [Candidatus Pacearchaeota archaeon]|nr:hypothetical protein [Candidatus Pacearchaeota archaeon]